MNRTIYSRAPITEAVIDLRVTQADGFSFEQLEKLKDILKSDYPNIKKQIENEFRVEVGENPSATSVVKEQGLRFASADGKYVLQAKASGFTLSRLQPYERWEPFRDEAKRLWKIYVSALKPTQITRAAVRFINRIDLPGPSVELKDYFTVYPQVPTQFEINHTVLQLIVPQKDIGCQLLINQALVPPPTPNVISIILDLDLFSDTPRKLDDEVWALYETMRERKDKIFEESITDKVRELIK